MSNISEQNDWIPPSDKPPAGLFVTDLDGTLLRSDRTVSEGDRASLRRLGNQHVIRVVATGRSLFSFGRIEAPRLPIDFVIFSTGAGIAQYPEGKILRRAGLTPEEVGRAERVLRELKLDFMIQRPIPETHVFGYAALNPFNPDFQTRIALYRPFAFPLDECDHRFGPATQLVAIVPRDRGAGALAAVRDQLSDLAIIRTTSPLDGQSTWIEIFPAGVSKSLSAQWLASRLGVPDGRTLSVGNDYNDIDLLEWAGTRFVTANAPEDLKGRFPAVASNNHEGVSEAIERWLDRERFRVQGWGK
jgi:hypothetical protein